MNNPATWIDSPHWLAAGWTMLHYLWVATAIGGVAAVGMQGLRSSPPHVRYLFALGCFALLALAPVGLGVWAFGNVPAVDVPLIDHSPAVDSLPTVSLVETEVQALDANEGDATASWVVTSDDSQEGDADRDVSGIAEPNRSHRNRFAAAVPAGLNIAARFLPLLWLCGAPLTFVLLATGLIGAERLRRDARLPKDAAIVELLTRLQRSLQVSRKVTIGVCDRIAGPILIGIVRPMILLPSAAMTGWSPEQIEMVLLHELAHVRRWDNLVNLLQRIVESLLFFHPVVWWVSNLLRREREHCCDSLVVERSGRPDLYARTLAVLAEQRSTFLETLAASAAAQTAAGSPLGEHHLTTRIRRILKRETEPMQVSRKTLYLVPLALLTAVTIITWYGLNLGYANSSGETQGLNLVVYADSARDTRDANVEKEIDAPAGVTTEPSDPGPTPIVDGPGPGVTPATLPPAGDESTTRTTQIRFVGPKDMRIGWWPRKTERYYQLQAPARHNFRQGGTYRLIFSVMPNDQRRYILELQSTLKIYPAQPDTNAYLSHNSVPLELTDEDLDQVQSNNVVTKVVYLPDAEHQELALAGVETLVSTRLDSGNDPVAEADRRGSIIAVLRMDDPNRPVPIQSNDPESRQTTSQGSQSTAVDKAAPKTTEDDLSPIRDVEGRVEFVDRVKLSSHRAGILAAVNVKEGDRVKKGQTLASLGEDEFHAAQVDLEIALTELKGINDRLPRIRQLREQKVIAAEELQKYELEAQLAELQVKKREQQLKSLQKQIEAPFDGMVTRVDKRPGEAVNPGDPIVEVIGLDRIRVKTMISYMEAWKWGVKRGMPVTFRIKHTDEQLPMEKATFQGTVSFVSPLTDPVAGTIDVYVDATNRDELLREGLKVLVSFAAAHRE